MTARIAELSVMVVEDHSFQRNIALRLLAGLGVERVYEAAHGRAALDILLTLQEKPDVLLVDLDLPEMDGIELIGHVASRRLARAVVVLSALDPALLHTVQTMARASGLRVLGAVEKPLTAAKLQEVLALFHHEAEESGYLVPVEFDRQTLVEAIEAEEIEPWFQPQVSIASGHAVSVEALARWVRNDQVLLPAQFLHQIEREGLIDALTESMLRKSCRWRVRWAAAGLDLRLSVNVSMLNLARVDTADRYQQIVQQAGVRTRDVVLEVTEGSVMGEAASALNVLARLRLKGFGLAIDDFGTGYSSLSQLSQIPFTELKIDQGFVTGAVRQPRKRAVVETSLALARKLDLGTVAEGVETLEDWQMLAELGCDYAQGYLISPAVSGTALVEQVRQWRSPQMPS
ncbi:EAL domain-containing response regulator [Tahibacter sp.]|uniref:EAL domain-containing response regulator n=1 Tax=Tahibacter sp. TaxID=2056211 RepID=UPI0028C4AF80|nr:EAL domain-containing response regulator [Tahibacter sp.]